MQLPLAARIYRYLLPITILMTIWGPVSIWRFPEVVFRNGGGAFLLFFVLFLIIYAGPMLCCEYAMGSYLKGPVKMFRAVPVFRAMGVATCGYIILMLPYYAALSSYSISYFRLTVSQYNTTFVSCGNVWNTPNCSLADEQTPVSLTPSEEYYMHVLQDFRSGVQLGQTGVRESKKDKFGSSLEGLDTLKAVSLLIFCVLLVPFFFYSPFSLGLLTFLCFVISVILLIYLTAVSAGLPGAQQGISTVFSANFTRAWEHSLDYDALNFIIYMMPFGMGIIATLTHYTKVPKFGYDVPVILVLFFGILLWNISMVWAFLGFIARSEGNSVTDIIRRGPELAFVLLPNAFSQMKNGQTVAAVFYSYITVLSLSSAAPMIEMINSAVYAVLDYSNRRMVRGKAGLVRFLSSLCVLLYTFIFGLVYCTKQGESVVGLLDSNLMYMICFVIAIQLAVLAAFFLIKIYYYGTQLEVMMTLQRKRYFLAAVAGILIMTLFNVIHGIRMVVRYATDYDRQQPIIAQGVRHRWVIGLIPLICFAIGTAICATFMIWKARKFEVKLWKALLLPYGTTETEIYQLATQYRKKSSWVYPRPSKQQAKEKLGGEGSEGKDGENVKLMQTPQKGGRVLNQ